jgi:hypothetical protein
VTTSSGGLMPDLVAPRPRTPARLLNPYKEQIMLYWGFANQVVIRWNFDDYESGVRNIHAAVIPQAEMRWEDGHEMEFYEMPFSVSVEPTDRQAELFFSDDPYAPYGSRTLQHATMYYLHICARDYMNHTACARPHQFFVDLTPPICPQPIDINGGRVAPEYTSRRSGVAAQWDCYDPESGVLISTWMPYRDNVPLLNRVFLIRGGRGRGSAAVTMRQASHYTNCVSATNGAGFAGADVCSNGMTYDSTAPYDVWVYDFDNSLYVNTTYEVCTTWPELRDDVAPLMYPELQLYQQRGIFQVPVSSPISITTLFNGMKNDWYGTISGDTWCHRVSEPLEAGAFYFSRLRVPNVAEPTLTRDIRTRGFIVDRTPAFDGVIELRVAFPEGFNQQPGFLVDPPSVLGLSFRVRLLSEFEEDESKIERYEIKMYADGVLFHEVRLFDGDLDEDYATERDWDTPVYNGTLLQLEVVCYNSVNMPSVPAVDEQLLILGRLEFDAPYVLKDETTERINKPIVEQDTSMSIAFERANDPIGTSLTTFRYFWSVLPNCSFETGEDRFQGQIRDSQGRHFSYPILDRYPLSSIARAHPDVQYTRTAIDDTDSDMLFVKSFDAALELGRPTCGMVQACTVPTDLLPERCINASTKLFVMDNTRPEGACGQPYPEAATGGMLPLKVPVGCNDPESGVKSPAWFSLGTVAEPALYIDEMPLFVSLVTNDTNTTNTSLLSYTANRTGFSGVVTLSDAFLESAGLDLVQGEQIMATLVCSNNANDKAEFLSETVRFDDEPPVQGREEYSQEDPAWIPSFTWSKQNQAYYGTVSRLPAEVIWQNFSDLGSGVASYQICLGELPYDCSYEELTALSSDTSAVFTNAPTNTQDGLALRFFVSITAIDFRGLETGLSLAAIIDTTPPNVSAVTATASTGHTTEGGLLVTSKEEFTLQFDELPFDVDTDDVDVKFRAYMSPDDTIFGTLRNCTYMVHNESAGTYKAHCVIEGYAHFCIDGVAVNIAGLSSESSTTCILVDKTAPVWAPEGVSFAHSKVANSTVYSGFLGSWTQPIDAESGLSQVEVSVCTYEGCQLEPLAGANQTNVFIPDDHPLLVDYDGQAWLKLVASNVAGVRAEIMSNRIVAARGIPTDGELILFADGRVGGVLRSAAAATIRIRGFLERFLGISFFSLCLGTSAGLVDIMPCQEFTSLKTLQDEFEIGTLFGSYLLPRTSSHLLVATATACNLVDECSTAISNTMQVDVGNPLAGWVADGLLEHDELEASEHVVIACEHGGVAGSCYGSHLTLVGGINAVDGLNFDTAGACQTCLPPTITVPHYTSHCIPYPTHPNRCHPLSPSQVWCFLVILPTQCAVRCTAL